MCCFFFHIIYFYACEDHRIPYIGNCLRGFNFRVENSLKLKYCNIVGLLHHPFWLCLVLALLASLLIF